MTIAPEHPAADSPAENARAQMDGIVLYDRSAKAPVMNRFIEVGPYSRSPDIDDLLDADAVLVTVPSLDKYHQAALPVKAIFDAVDRPTPLLLIAVNTCIASCVKDAVYQFESNVCSRSSARSNRFWYVGTQTGLEGLIRDLQLLNFGDGVVILPLRTTFVSRHPPTAPARRIMPQ